jgi:hypothetical protein
MLRIAFLMLVAVAAMPAQAKQRTVIEPLPAELLANNHVVGVEVTVVNEALSKFDAHEKKAAEKRAEKKLAPFDATLASATRPVEDEYPTLPFAAMVPLVVEDVTREWGLTGGRPVKLKVRVSQLKTADAGMAILIASSDELTGLVSVHDAATDAELGSFLINVVNSHSGWGGMLMRGGSIREKLVEEFALETSRMLTGRKSKKIKKAKSLAS